MNEVLEVQGVDKAQLSRWTICAASSHDMDEILRIEQASFSAPWTAKMIEAEVEGNPFASFLVARKVADGEIVGYICYWIVFEELRLMNLAVAPAQRRQGIAAALIQRALQDGRHREAKRAVLEVRASNAAALNLYRTFGFQQTAIRARYYANPIEDAILMELSPIGAAMEGQVKAQAED